MKPRKKKPLKPINVNTQRLLGEMGYGPPAPAKKKKKKTKKAK